MTVADLVGSFLLHSERNGCKPSTLRHYRGRLKKFVEAFGPRPPRKVGREEVLNHLYAVGKGLSDSTRRSDIVAVELLQAYAVDYGHLKDPWIRKKKDIKKPPQGYRERIASVEETQKLLKAAPEDFALIYRVLRLTGARPSEVCGANISDIKGEGDERVLVLQEHKTSRKTGKPRRIPLGAAVAPLFDKAVAGRTEGRVFVDRRGLPWDRDRLSRHFRLLRNKLGLSKELVLYSTRHEFGTAVAHEFGLLQASRLLGHTNTKMTERYTKTPEEQLRDVQGKAIKDVDPGPAGSES